VPAEEKLCEQSSVRRNGRGNRSSTYRCQGDADPHVFNSVIDAFHDSLRPIAASKRAHEDKGIVQTNPKDDKWKNLRHRREWNAANKQQSEPSHEAQQYADYRPKAEQASGIDRILPGKDSAGEDSHDDEYNRDCDSKKSNS
jgi:hypothetical protein